MALENIMSAVQLVVSLHTMLFCMHMKIETRREQITVATEVEARCLRAWYLSLASGSIGNSCAPEETVVSAWGRDIELTTDVSLHSTESTEHARTKPYYAHTLHKFTFFHLADAFIQSDLERALQSA